jgi:HK97 family phage portal protein
VIGRALVERRAEGFPPTTVTSAHATTVPGNVTGPGMEAMRRIDSGNGLSIPAFWGGVRMIAETVAMVPLEIQRTDPTGVVKTEQNRLSRLLGVSANVENSAGQLWEYAILSLLLRGNAYIWKERDRDGRVIALWPLSPARVAVGRDPVTRRKVFAIAASYDDGDPTPAMSSDVLHIRAPGLDALVGWSLLRFQRPLLYRSTMEADYQTAQLENGARFSGFLSTDGTLTDPAAAKVAARWRAAQGGVANAGRTPVLEQGMKFNQVSMSAADAQFLEQRQYTRQEIAIILNLPASKVLAESGGNLHYDSAAMDLEAYAQGTIAPWTARIERALLQDPDFPWTYTGPRAGSLSPHFRLGALTDAVRSTRYADYLVGRRAGFLLPSDIRSAEGLDPVEGIDDTPPPSLAGGSKQGLSS